MKNVEREHEERMRKQGAMGSGQLIERTLAMLINRVEKLEKEVERLQTIVWEGIGADE